MANRRALISMRKLVVIVKHEYSLLIVFSIARPIGRSPKLNAGRFTVMRIEIEKKYRLSKKQRELVMVRLKKIGAIFKREEFEENTLYAGDGLDTHRSALRLRRIGKRATLTYKERFASASPIKLQREDETNISDPDAMESILDALGLTPALVYEKRRAIWKLGSAEIVVDELPFGLFMEIEGAAKVIQAVEHKLSLKNLRAEPATYPSLTKRHGKLSGNVVEARFPSARPGSYRIPVHKKQSGRAR